MNRDALLDRLNDLLPAQFDELIFRLDVPPEFLTGTAQTTRSIEVIRYLAGQNRLPQLTELLARPGDRAADLADDSHRGGPLRSRPLVELIDELETLLIQRARQVVDDVKRGVLTVAIDALVAEVKRRGRLREGDMVAGTQLLKVIGTGNFGTIYLGRREADGVCLATKVFHLDKITEGMMLWSFRRSIKAMRHLNADKSAPSSIIRIHEAAEDTLAFSMDYLSGGNLEDIASRGWTLKKKMDVFAEICSSVAFAHEKGVIHRDIKPANVVLNEQQQPVLTDFDISDVKYLTKLSVARGSLGTPVFAAPEQLEDGNNATERSDIYSLGRVLYYLLLERSPGYQIESDPQLANLSSYQTALVSIVRRATQHSPANRYASVKDLLHEVKNHQSRTAALRAHARESVRWVRKNAALLAIFTLVISGLGAFGIYQTRVARDKELQRKQQEELARKNASLVQTLTELQEVQDDAQKSLNELSQRQGDLNHQRVVLEQQIKMLNEEITNTTPNESKRLFLASKRAALMKELATLTSEQARFNREIAVQRLKLERAKAAARTASMQANSDISPAMPKVASEDASVHRVHPVGRFVNEPDSPSDAQVSMTRISDMAGTFFIDRREVSVDEYEACIHAGGCTPTAMMQSSCNLWKPDRRDHPINCVTQEQAVRYCKWMKKRLPTSKEWQRALAYTIVEGQSPRQAIEQTCVNRSYSDGSCKRNSHSALAIPLDMIGNVAEWTSDPSTARGSCWVDQTGSDPHMSRLGAQIEKYRDCIGLRCAGR